MIIDLQDVPIVRESGLNVTGRSSNDGYTSIPPNFQGNVPAPRMSRFSGMAPRAAGPDRVQRSFAPEGDVASRYRMVYTYLPLRGAEKSRQEYTDGVVYVSLVFYNLHCA